MPEQKQTVVSFRVDQHLAEILNSLPDKSAFIRDAILQRYHTVCPFCQGRGVLPQMVAEWLKKQVPDFESVECACCHYEYPTDVVKQELKGRKRGRFVCAHCGDHDHSH
jgi:hypothetical protein